MNGQDATQPTEEELRAYEEELSRITSTQLVVQAAASLLNVGGRRLGLAEGLEHERDLEQVRDAIDAVMGLLPILDRRMPAAQARPLRDALSQLQMAYARVAQSQPAGQAQSQSEGQAPSRAADQAPPQSAGQTPPQSEGQAPTPSEAAPAGGASPGGNASPAGDEGAQQPASDDAPSSGPGPAERSGRLWVPGR